MTITRRTKIVFAVTFFVTLAVYAVGWALTADQIWQKIYDSVNLAIRVNQVKP